MAEESIFSFPHVTRISEATNVVGEATKRVRRELCPLTDEEELCYRELGQNAFGACRRAKLELESSSCVIIDWTLSGNQMDHNRILSTFSFRAKRIFGLLRCIVISKLMKAILLKSRY